MSISNKKQIIEAQNKVWNSWNHAYSHLLPGWKLDVLMIENDELKQRINRLEQSGDALEKWLDRNTPVTVRNDWKAAREAKP